MAAKKPAVPAKSITLEEQIEAAVRRDHSLESYATRHLPIPVTKLEVGDEVFLGNIDDAVVVAVLEEGRRVAVQHSQHHWLREGKEPTQKTVQVVPAFDVQRKSDESDETFSRPNHYILSYSQRDVSGLMSMITSFGVDMNPEYQRDLVWEESDKVRLIDSMFNQVDIGKFVFRKLPFTSGGPGYEVVDGKQRLSALIDFVSDKFAYQGKTWSQLSRTDRNYIDNYTISYAQLAETYTRQQILNLFVRLNTGGKQMDPAHLEKVAKMAAEAAPATKAPGPKR